jgi:hypothetical protein
MEIGSETRALRTAKPLVDMLFVEVYLQPRTDVSIFKPLLKALSLGVLVDEIEPSLCTLTYDSG